MRRRTSRFGAPHAAPAVREPPGPFLFPVRMTPHGLLVLDKPPGITSRDAVDRAAKWFPRKTKIGHAGTLDPLATGVLVLAVGHADAADRVRPGDAQGVPDADPPRGHERHRRRGRDGHAEPGSRSR